MEKIKQFKALGAVIYPDHLQCLIVPSETGRSRYLNESLIVAYISMRCYLERNNIDPVSVFVCETLLAAVNDIDVMKYSLADFVKYDVPRKDIVILPIVEHSHCTLFIILKHLNIIIYLDSLHFAPRQQLINGLLTLINSYYEFLGEEVPKEQFQVYTPKDIPLQRNGIDCGLYACLFADVILQQSTEFVRMYHDNDQMNLYRLYMYDKVMSVLRSNPPPENLSLRKRRYNRQNLLNKFDMKIVTSQTLSVYQHP